MFRRCNILIIFEITQIVFGNQELCSNDPCTADNLLTLSDVEERSPMCSDGGGNKCDGWYQVNIPMSNKCSGLNWIGTVFSVWLNGSGPSETDGAVERNVCIVGPDSCCATSLSIKIKKCSNFTAYCLKKFPSCPIRYCFGEGEKCNEENTTTETIETTVVTTINKDSESATEYASNLESEENHHNTCVDLYVLIGITVCFLLIQVTELVACFVCSRRRKPGAKEDHKNHSSSDSNGTKVTNKSIKQNEKQEPVGDTYEILDEPTNVPNFYAGMSKTQEQNTKNASKVNECQSFRREIKQKLTTEIKGDTTSKIYENTRLYQPENDNMYEPIENQIPTTSSPSFLKAQHKSPQKVSKFLHGKKKTLQPPSKKSSTLKKQENL